MHVDLTTVYLLLIGTLFASSGMTLWECRAHPQRGRPLKLLAVGYATLGIGCAAATFRLRLPGAIGSAASNLVIVAGYLLVLHGAASLGGNSRRYRPLSMATLALLALAWGLAGARRQETMWYFWSAIPIATTSAMTAIALLKVDVGRRQSRYIAVLIAGIHALFYALRASVLPWSLNRYGVELLRGASAITMYEGVLYSVVLPMIVLKMVREETHDRLLHESRTDYLTGLCTRRCFFEEGAQALRHSKSPRPAALLAFDLDRFKSINDQYGHETGDRVIQSFARIARDVLGSSTLVARIGGEEFAALLPRCDRRRAMELGERIVARFAAERANLTGPLGTPVTVSVGLAEFDEATRTLAELLATADRALYRAKSLGGNRLELEQRPLRDTAA
jgi:diguanylate cyclase (GGDEF)-like protein